MHCTFKYIVLQGLLIVSVVNYKPLKYDSEYEIPLGGQLLGLAVGFTHVVFVPLYFLWALLVAPGVKIAEVRDGCLR